MSRTAPEIEQDLAALRERLEAVEAALPEAEAAMAPLLQGWEDARRLWEEAGRDLQRVGTRLQVAQDIIIVNGAPAETDPALAVEGDRLYRQAHGGWQLAYDELGAAQRAYQASAQRHSALLGERRTLEYRISVAERELDAVQGRAEARREHVEAARSWLDRVRLRVAGARA